MNEKCKPEISFSPSIQMISKYWKECTNYTRMHVEDRIARNIISTRSAQPHVFYENARRYLRSIGISETFRAVLICDCKKVSKFIELLGISHMNLTFDLYCFIVDNDLSIFYNLKFSFSQCRMTFELSSSQYLIKHLSKHFHLFTDTFEIFNFFC
uniref:Uncharacterized protein n=1 Tax=Onchocerca volvulus TaxID=6282 RepID=A0A8R1TIL4_ONCVO